jgi:hypothetical protein
MSYFFLVTVPLVVIATFVVGHLFKVPYYLVAAIIIIILGTTWLFG